MIDYSVVSLPQLTTLVRRATDNTVYVL